METPVATLSTAPHAASFRDPGGFLFHGDDGTLYRQVNRSSEADLRLLEESGLYEELISNKLLIEHQADDLSKALTREASSVIRPRLLPFISYPYEWSYSALKDAALLTIDIQRRALKRDMSLKDASSYNVQFEGGRPVFIDTLSFEAYEPGSAWSAYGQFCRHFLAPLALMSYRNVSLGKLLSIHLDGVPLDLASSLLPWKTKWNFGLQVHLHMHAKMVARHSDTSSGAAPKKANMSKASLDALLGNLAKTVSKLDWTPAGTEWADYYANTSYTQEARTDKEQAVADFLQQAQPETVWDLGANTGEFSRLASQRGAMTCAFDIDPACVERNYRYCREQGTTNLLPLVLDLTNPSPAIGWAHNERDSLADRGPVDTVMALALIHHLAISNNVPLPRVAQYFAQLGRQLIIEFVPKEDPQVKRLLLSREDIFPNYDREGFEAAFAQHFEIAESRKIGDDGRVLYRLVRRENSMGSIA